MFTKGAWIAAKFITNLLAFFVLWWASTLAAWLADQPSDFAFVGSALLISVAVIAFIGVVFLLWRENFKEMKTWFQD